MSSLSAEINILSCILLPCLTPYVEEIIKTFMNLFRHDRSITDHVRRSNQKLEKSRDTVKAESHIACRANAVPLPCRVAKGLECVFPIWFTHCGRVWFTLAMPCPFHALTMPFFSWPQHNTALSRRPFCAVALRRIVWSEHGMGVGMAWQVWIRHGRTV
jgi:hypothetical protein